MFLVCQTPTAMMLIYQYMTMHVEKNGRLILGEFFYNIQCIIVSAIHYIKDVMIK